MTLEELKLELCGDGNRIYEQSIMASTIDLIHAKDLLHVWNYDMDSAPKDGSTLLIFDSFSTNKEIDGYGMCTARWDASLKWWIMHQRNSNVISLINPTAWMPLPNSQNNTK